MITVLAHFCNKIKQTLTSAGSDILTAANSALLTMYFVPSKLLLVLSNTNTVLYDEVNRILSETLFCIFINRF